MQNTNGGREGRKTDNKSQNKGGKKTRPPPKGYHCELVHNKPKPKPKPKAPNIKTAMNADAAPWTQRVVSFVARRAEKEKEKVTVEDIIELEEQAQTATVDNSPTREDSGSSEDEPTSSSDEMPEQSKYVWTKDDKRDKTKRRHYKNKLQRGFKNHGERLPRAEKTPRSSAQIAWEYCLKLWKAVTFVPKKGYQISAGWIATKWSDLTATYATWQIATFLALNGVFVVGAISALLLAAGAMAGALVVYAKKNKLRNKQLNWNGFQKEGRMKDALGALGTVWNLRIVPAWILTGLQLNKLVDWGAMISWVTTGFAVHFAPHFLYKRQPFVAPLLTMREGVIIRRNLVLDDESIKEICSRTDSRFIKLIDDDGDYSVVSTTTNRAARDLWKKYFWDHIIAEELTVKDFHVFLDVNETLTFTTYVNERQAWRKESGKGSMIDLTEKEKEGESEMPPLEIRSDILEGTDGSWSMYIPPQTPPLGLDPDDMAMYQQDDDGSGSSILSDEEVAEGLGYFDKLDLSKIDVVQYMSGTDMTQRQREREVIRSSQSDATGLGTIMIASFELEKLIYNRPRNTWWTVIRTKLVFELSQLEPRIKLSWFEPGHQRSEAKAMEYTKEAVLTVMTLARWNETVNEHWFMTRRDAMAILFENSLILNVPRYCNIAAKMSLMNKDPFDPAAQAFFESACINLSHSCSTGTCKTCHGMFSREVKSFGETVRVHFRLYKADQIIKREKQEDIQYFEDLKQYAESEIAPAWKISAVVASTLAIIFVSVLVVGICWYYHAKKKEKYREKKKKEAEVAVTTALEKTLTEHKARKIKKVKEPPLAKENRDLYDQDKHFVSVSYAVPGKAGAELKWNHRTWKGWDDLRNDLKKEFPEALEIPITFATSKGELRNSVARLRQKRDLEKPKEDITGVVFAPDVDDKPVFNREVMRTGNEADSVFLIRVGEEVLGQVTRTANTLNFVEHIFHDVLYYVRERRLSPTKSVSIGGNNSRVYINLCDYVDEKVFDDVEARDALIKIHSSTEEPDKYVTKSISRFYKNTHIQPLGHDAISLKLPANMQHFASWNHEVIEDGQRVHAWYVGWRLVENGVGSVSVKSYLTRFLVQRDGDLLNYEMPHEAGLCGGVIAADNLGKSIYGLHILGQRRGNQCRASCFRKRINPGELRLPISDPPAPNLRGAEVGHVPTSN